MSKSVKVPDEIWETLIKIKIRDKRKNMGEVITDLLAKAKEVNINDTSSNSKANKD